MFGWNILGSGLSGTLQVTLQVTLCGGVLIALVLWHHYWFMR